MIERDPLLELKAENTRLIALLEANGIQWRAQLEHGVPPASTPESSRLSTDEKVALFRRLFRGRTDVYPVRWESKTSVKSGLAGLRQRMARRCLREAAHQMRGLWQPTADPAIGCRPIRSSCR